jgi:hypothetical protein
MLRIQEQEHGQDMARVQRSPAGAAGVKSFWEEPNQMPRITAAYCKQLGNHGFTRQRISLGMLKVKKYFQNSVLSKSWTKTKSICQTSEV